LFLPLQHSGDKSVSDETDLSTATLVPQECDEAGEEIEDLVVNSNRQIVLYLKRSTFFLPDCRSWVLCLKGYSCSNDIVFSFVRRTGFVSKLSLY